MKQGKHRNLWLELTVIVASVLALALLVYFVMIVSFQSGVSSTNVTMRLADRIARIVFVDPEQEQIETVSRMIRYGAHFRILGILLSGAVCYMMAYYTEYFKQYVDGRHFQMTDVQLNWYGCLAGIFCMVGSYFLNRLLVKMSS